MTDDRNIANKFNKIKKDYLNTLHMQLMDNQVHEENNRPRTDGQFQRDFARIMYSSSFRRLQGKMQLIGIQNDQFFRNRLTHSLEVAQIARSIAGMLGYDSGESYVVEAGALAHDLGNPPFGHAGERCLNNIYKEIGGFEGNAQTLRILTNIERKRPDFRGLNLTYRTLLSVVKYFKQFDKTNEDKQKFIYGDDYELLSSAIQESGIIVRTLDVQIVDIADEIAYAAHDLEDGLRINAFTVEEILHDYQAKFRNSAGYMKLTELVDNARTNAGYGKASIESTQYSKLFRQELASSLINMALKDIGLISVNEAKKIKTGTQQFEELGFCECGEIIHGLKDIVFKCINHNDDVYHYEQEGKKALYTLARHFQENILYLPPEYRAKELMKQYPDLKKDNEDILQGRLTCDYIAGMMDSYAIKQYERFSGAKFMK